MSRVNVFLKRIDEFAPRIVFAVFDSDPKGITREIGRVEIDLTTRTYSFKKSDAIDDLQDMLPPEFWELQDDERQRLLQSKFAESDNRSLSRAIHVHVMRIIEQI